MIIVDVQPSFLNGMNCYIVQNIINRLQSVPYNLYIEANFHTEKGSLWDRQQSWICPKGKDTETIKELADALLPFNPVKVSKGTKSVFKGNVDVTGFLKAQAIDEVHIVGFDTNDCVLATAYESFDLGFLTYVIPNCCQSSASNELHDYAVRLLEWQEMLKL